MCNISWGFMVACWRVPNMRYDECGSKRLHEFMLGTLHSGHSAPPGENICFHRYNTPKLSIGLHISNHWRNTGKPTNWQRTFIAERGRNHVFACFWWCVGGGGHFAYARGVCFGGMATKDKKCERNHINRASIGLCNHEWKQNP